MKKINLTILIGILLIGIISAGIGIGALNKQREMNKAQRDILLSKTDLGEINPNIIIKCSDDFCLWSAEQDKIISSNNNQIQRYWINCSLYNQIIRIINETHNETINTECLNLERINYTDNEIQDIVADAVLDKLERFANASISREVYEDWGTGNVEIIEE